MNYIDFWNLAGRAGRLSKDLSGNVFCVNLFNREGYWKDENKTSLLRNKKFEHTKPYLMSRTNNNLYKNLGNYLINKQYTNKSFSETQKDIIEMYGNILIYHDAINGDSILKDKFFDKNQDAISILKKVRDKLEVPSEIMANNININFALQNKIMKNDTPILPTETNFRDCLSLLEILYDQYSWDKTETKGRNPMINSKSKLKYLAVIMEAWVNEKPLKYLINSAVNYYYNNGDEKEIRLIQSGKCRFVKFNKENEVHINEIINNVINDIEQSIRFKIKNYVSNYQSLLQAKSIQIKADWEKFVEYGSSDQNLIDIQNLGFTRSLAILLKEQYLQSFIFTKEGEIYDIDREMLLQIFDKEKYYDEYIQVIKQLGEPLIEESEHNH